MERPPGGDPPKFHARAAPGKGFKRPENGPGNPPGVLGPAGIKKREAARPAHHPENPPGGKLKRGSRGRFLDGGATPLLVSHPHGWKYPRGAVAKLVPPPKRNRGAQLPAVVFRSGAPAASPGGKNRFPGMGPGPKERLEEAGAKIRPLDLPGGPGPPRTNYAGGPRPRGRGKGPKNRGARGLRVWGAPFPWLFLGRGKGG